MLDSVAIVSVPFGQQHIMIRDRLTETPI